MARETKSVEKLPTPGPLARPDFIPRGSEGTKHITKDDLQLPRIGIAQKLSPELSQEESKFIEGLRQGDMFNNLTKEIIGPGPLMFHVVRADPPRGIEFNPRESGGGIKDFDVKLTDPRMQFTVNSEGKSVPPAATKFYDFVIVPLPVKDFENPMQSIIALSMKSSQLKVARALNGLIVMRGADLWAGRYSLEIVSESNAKGTWYNFKISNAGWCDDAAQLESFKQLAESIKDKRLDIEREQHDADPDAEGAEKEM